MTPAISVTPRGAPSSERGGWQPNTPYFQDDVVIWQGTTYQSISTYNVGNQPDLHPEAWAVGLDVPLNVLRSVYSGGLAPIEGVAPVANVLDPQWGGLADAGQSVGSINSGSNQLTITSGPVPVAKQAVLLSGAGAGTPTGPFIAWVQSVAGSVLTLVTAPGGSTPANATNTITNGTVSYGTDIAPVVLGALASGYRVHMPEGKYVWASSITPSTFHLTGDGPGRTVVYFYGNQKLATVDGAASGYGLVGSVGALTANAVAGAQTLTVGGGIPAGINPGDYIFLSSTDVFSSAEPFCTRGEFLRVLALSGTTVYLQQAVAGPYSYLTASSAQIQKVTFMPGVRLEGVEWINGTPEILSASNPQTQVASGGSGAGIIIKKAFRPHIEDQHVQGWVGSFFLLTNCIYHRVVNADGQDGAYAPNGAGAYGYLVEPSGSQWGEVVSTAGANSHSSVNHSGTGQVVGDIVLPSNQCEVRGCTHRQGGLGGWVCHNASAFIDFIDCKLLGAPAIVPEGAHDSGFILSGAYCRTINPIIINAGGRPITMSGPNCEAIAPIIRNVLAWADRCCGIWVNADSCRVVSPDIDGVGAAPSGGQGILLSVNATNFELAGIPTIRNTASDAVFIGDTTGSETVFQLTAINAGGYAINTASAVVSPRWRRVFARGCASGVTNFTSAFAVDVWHTEKRRGGGNLAGGTAAGNYVLFVNGTPAAVAGAGTAIAAFYIDPVNDFPTGVINLYRLRASAITDGAPGCDLVFSLCPVTGWAGGGGSGNPTINSIGAAVMTVTLTNASLTANTPVHGESAARQAFTAGWYALIVAPAAGLAAASAVAVGCDLQVARTV